MNDTQFMTRVKTPANCTPDELAAFCALVNSGAEVANLSPGWVGGHGLKLVFLTIGGVLVAVGALKMPERDYHQSCFRKAGKLNEWTAYPIELGWVYCENAYRGGMSYRVMDPLLNEQEGRGLVYATVRANNIPMSRALENRNFKVLGIPYRSVENPGSKIQLFVRPGL